MTEITKELRVDAKAQAEGEVIDLDRYGFKGWVRTRSIHAPSYRIAREMKMSKLLRIKQRDKSLPAEERKALNSVELAQMDCELLRDELLIDTGGLFFEGVECTVAKLKQLVVDPNFSPLAGLCMLAARDAGQIEAELEEADRGNSRAPSDGGADTEKTTSS